jgi:hypothetical protein
MPYHIQAARNAILLYIKETGNADFVDGKMIFYREAQFWEKHGIQFGRLSELAHFVPKYLQKNRMPSLKPIVLKIGNLKLMLSSRKHLTKI